MNDNLNKKGLSMSQAQSISNLCNQRAETIGRKLSLINNCSKTIKVDGEDLKLVEDHPIPENIEDLLMEKCSLHACQAFLMENISAKETMLWVVQKFNEASIDHIKYPDQVVLIKHKVISEVDESWGKSQLTSAELNEYYEAEAYAAHFGQFIHKNSKLDKLRTELPNLPSVEWEEIERGKKTPVKVIKHHSSDQLFEIHEKLAKTHRKYEQRVNYYKAKIKNSVTLRNAEIAKENGIALSEATAQNTLLQEAFTAELVKYNEAVKAVELEHEEIKQLEIKRISALRINVDPRFKEIVDSFLTEVKKNEE